MTVMLLHKCRVHMQILHLLNIFASGAKTTVFDNYALRHLRKDIAKSLIIYVVL